MLSRRLDAVWHLCNGSNWSVVLLFCWFFLSHRMQCLKPYDCCERFLYWFIALYKKYTHYYSPGKSVFFWNWNIILSTNSSHIHLSNTCYVLDTSANLMLIYQLLDQDFSVVWLFSPFSCVVKDRATEIVLVTGHRHGIFFLLIVIKRLWRRETLIQVNDERMAKVFSTLYWVETKIGVHSPLPSQDKDRRRCTQANPLYTGTRWS